MRYRQAQRPYVVEMLLWNLQCFLARHKQPDVRRYMMYFDGKRRADLRFEDGKLVSRNMRDLMNFEEDRKVYAGMFQFFYLRLGIFFGCLGIFINLFRGEMLDRLLPVTALRCGIGFQMLIERALNMAMAAHGAGHGGQPDLGVRKVARDQATARHLRVQQGIECMQAGLLCQPECRLHRLPARCGLPLDRVIERDGARPEDEDHGGRVGEVRCQLDLKCPLWTSRRPSPHRRRSWWCAGSGAGSRPGCRS